MQDRLYDTDRVMAPIPANHLKTKIISADGKAEVSRSRHDQITAKYTERTPGTGRWVSVSISYKHTPSPLFLDVFLSLCLSVCLFLSVFLIFFESVPVFLTIYFFVHLYCVFLPPLLCLPLYIYISLSLSLYASICLSLCLPYCFSVSLFFLTDTHRCTVLSFPLFPVSSLFRFHLLFIFILNVCKY